MNQNIPESENSKPKFGNIKDELFLISFIILCAGIVFTDSYYQRFGYRYQFFDFPTMHIIYKGLTMIINYPLILIPYLLTITLILFESYAIRKNFMAFLAVRTPISYIFLILNLVIILPIADRAGRHQAMIDMQDETSKLPRVEKLITKLPLVNPKDTIIQYPKYNYRLFMIDNDFVTIFVPLDREDESMYPIIKRISKEEVLVIQTTF